MDIFQTAVTSLKIIREFVEGCKSFSHDAASLALRLTWDERILQRLMEYFERRKVSAGNQNLSSEDEELLSEIAEFLSGLLDSIGSVRNKLQRKSWKKLWTQATWTLRSEEVYKFESELYEWTGRFGVRLVALPDNLKAMIDLSQENVTDRDSPAVYVAQRIEALKLQHPHIDATTLRCEPHDVQLQEKIDRSLDCYRAQYKSKASIIEYYAQSRLLESKEACEELAFMLSLVNPIIMGCLRCSAFFTDADRNRYGLVYEVPPHLKPKPGEDLRTLYALLRETSRTKKVIHPLNQRFALATRIATALLCIHSIGWVHKSLRSDNILIFETPSADKTHRFPFSIGTPYLIGFPYARQDDADSAPIAFQEPSKISVDIYRHPNRQGPAPVERFSMCHDVYSLGVVLLEIGLWSPVGEKQGDLDGKTSTEVKDYLLKMAQRLSVVMGRKYRDIVLTCLRMGENDEIGSAKYVREILGKLEELSLAMN